MFRTLGTLSVLLALVCPGLATAQQAYPFETVSRGSGGGLADSPLQALIRSEQELQASGASHLIPPGASIDFSREALLVAKMGSRPTGGYAIEIRAVEVQPPNPSVPGGPAISLTTVLNVKVFSRSPGPGEIVTQAFTSPYHVVKVARPAMGGLVANFEALSTSVDFDTFRRSEGSLFHAKSIEVSKDGAVSIYERAPGTNDTINASGQVAPALVEQLRRALAQVDYPSLPADLGDDPLLMDAPGVSYVLSLNGSDQIKSGTLPVIPQALKDRLRPLDATLGMIRDEVFASLPTFDAITFSNRKPLGADAFIQTLTIQADGTAKLEQRYLLREVMILPQVLQLSSAQLQELQMRVRMARMSTLAENLPEPIFITEPERFKLQVTSQNPDNVGHTAGVLGYYETYRFRLERFVDLLTAIRDDVEQNGTPAGDDEFKGEVVVEGGEVKLRGPQETYTLQGDLANTIRRFRGETVKVAGQIGAGEIQVSDILYPERKQLMGSVERQGWGRVRFLTGGSSVRIRGRARRVLRAAGDNLVIVDGWVFSDLNTGQIERIAVESVGGKVTRTAPLTLSGQFQGIVRTGDEVEVLALSSSGRYARVKTGSLEGYMRISRLQIGEPVVALPAASGPGISGSLGQ